jgi:FlaA1/EpsC-like NDP-sugar epimerase
MTLEDTFKGKRIMITGASGSVGSALARRLLSSAPKGEVWGLDNDETGLFTLGNELGSGFVPVLGDVRDRDKLVRSFHGMDVVFHAAALKHVPLCEHHPLEAVQTNILGVQNVIHAAMANKVRLVVYTSTDKAVNPPNVMGTSKLMGEQLIKAANVTDRREGMIFTSTRFGNVLGSNGSVLPVFREQIRKGGPVTLTDRLMTRFIMDLDKAVDLVLEAAMLARGGEVFITKMKTVRIIDLAQVMIDELAPKYGFNPANIEVEEIGTRPGEKLYEELMNSEEVRRSIELKNHFVVLPALTDMYKSNPDDYLGLVSSRVEKEYNSANEDAMKPGELRQYLIETGLLD